MDHFTEGKIYKCLNPSKYNADEGVDHISVMGVDVEGESIILYAFWIDSKTMKVIDVSNLGITKNDIKDWEEVNR